MSADFVSYIEIRDQNYEMVLKENDSTFILFKDIFPKIQHIVRISLKEGIDFSTHEFEIFEKFSTEGSIVRSFGKFIESESIIRIRPKTEEEMSSLVSTHTSLPSMNRQNNGKPEQRTSTETPAVSSIPQTSGWTPNRNQLPSHQNQNQKESQHNYHFYHRYPDWRENRGRYNPTPKANHCFKTTEPMNYRNQRHNKSDAEGVHTNGLKGTNQKKLKPTVTLFID